MKKTIFNAALILLALAWLSPVMAQNSLVGTVNYHDDPSSPMPEVTLYLYDSNDNLMMSTTTNDDGEYQFDNIPFGTFYLTSETALDPGDVTLQDAFLIMMHLFGLYPFNDVEFAAADVNGSGNITWGDYVLVMVAYLTNGQPFPVGEWQFEDVELEFVASRDLGTPDTAKVWATGSGDVEGIWMPSGRSLALVEGVIGQEVTLSEELVSVPIRSDYLNTISGYHLDIEFPADAVTIEGITGPDNNIHYAVEGNHLRVTWMDECDDPGKLTYGSELCTLQMHMAANTEQADHLFTLNNGMLIDGKGQAIPGVSIELPVVKTISTRVEAQTYPNPATEYLMMRIDPCNTATATIEVFDGSGRKVQEMEVQLSNTQPTLTSLQTSFLNTGTYSYRVVTNNKETLASGRFFKSN